jgi:alanyl-tRNA synthetase
MAKQRERARASWKGAEKKTASPAYVEIAKEQNTVFDGYQQVRSEKCMIVALVRRGKIANEVKPGDEVEIVLHHTPFYAESGGQVGDTG